MPPSLHKRDQHWSGRRGSVRLGTHTKGVREPGQGKPQELLLPPPETLLLWRIRSECLASCPNSRSTSVGLP